MGAHADWLVLRRPDRRPSIARRVLQRGLRKLIGQTIGFLGLCVDLQCALGQESGLIGYARHVMGRSRQEV
jgi:hypothetical protein